MERRLGLWLYQSGLGPALLQDLLGRAQGLAHVEVGVAKSLAVEMTEIRVPLRSVCDDLSLLVVVAGALLYCIQAWIRGVAR